MSRLRLSRGWLPAAAALGLGLAALLRSSAGAQSPWSLLPLEGARRTGTFRDPRLVENSGVIPSRTQPGILWTLADSDGPARIFATDTLGEDRGSFRLRGARNVDWEAISAGRCEAGICLYVADTGDNLEQRQSVQLYRIREPRVDSLGREPRTSSRVERLEVRYPDGSHDVEAAFVDGQGDVHLISKGRTSGFRHYRVPAGAWSAPATVAQPLGVLTIEEGRSLGRLVTDAAISPNGRLVAVRTYAEIFLFHFTGRGTLRPAWMGCRLAGLELQGEGVAWLDDSTVVLTSEGILGMPGTISLGRCSSTSS
ncbi:MAG: hypothetical protein H0T68_01105 [Gemmatimonadales bacterium]|nr:hypothetical protein [Gemmatimonadales bacterium]